MPLRNRVLPTGEIVADPARGTLTGNRGILHVEDGVMGPALWKHRAWIACTLDWQGRRRKVMSGRKWTELFFLDEAVALAVGHRPCAYCRRPDWLRWKAAWSAEHGPAKAPEIDAILHRARARPGARAMRRGQVHDLSSLPEGAFALLDGVAHLILRDRAIPFAADGYGTAKPLPEDPAEVLTPEPTLGVLRAGYVPALHPTAGERTGVGPGERL